MAEIQAPLHPMLLRSLKRTHDMYLANYGQRPADNEQSLSLRIACKVKSEYGLVKDMPAAPAANSAAAAGAQKSGTEVAAAPAPLMLQDKGSAAKPAGGPASKAASSAVVAHVGTGGTHIMPRRRGRPLRAHPHPPRRNRGSRRFDALPSPRLTTRRACTRPSLVCRNLQRDMPKPEWHAPWKLMRVISGHLGWVRAIAVDPTNQWYVTGSADRTIKVWDLASGTLKLTLTGHISTVRGLAVRCATGRLPGHQPTRSQRGSHLASPAPLPSLAPLPRPRHVVTETPSSPFPPYTNHQRSRIYRAALL